jgi:hypothetical protein
MVKCTLGQRHDLDVSRHRLIRQLHRTSASVPCISGFFGLSAFLVRSAISDPSNVSGFSASSGLSAFSGFSAFSGLSCPIGACRAFPHIPGPQQQYAPDRVRLRPQHPKRSKKRSPRPIHGDQHVHRPYAAATVTLRLPHMRYLTTVSPWGKPRKCKPNITMPLHPTINSAESPQKYRVSAKLPLKAGNRTQNIIQTNRPA